MIGLIQILVYLLCLNLIYQGAHIFQTAWMSPKEKKYEGMVFGVLMFAVSIVIAAAFAYWVTQWGAEVQRSLDELQKKLNAMPPYR